ncbi:MAG: polysaccharide deacetylase family protein, partial [Akkermansia sp.]
FFVMKIRLFPCLAVVGLLASCSFHQNVDQEQALEKVEPTICPHAGKQATPKKPVLKKDAQAPVVPTSDAKTPKTSIPVVIPQSMPAKPSKPMMPGARVARVSIPDKVVALTFDDGPHGSLTPRVLDILDRYNAKGTFFVLGLNAQRSPSILRRMNASGHEIGNHTWNHLNMSHSSRAVIESDLIKAGNAIESACGVTPKLIRPPYGASNSALCSWMRDRFGATAVLWDVDTVDWRKPGVSVVISRAVNGAKPGSIILLHDIHASSVDAVEGIVRGLQNRGFKIVTVSDLISRGRAYARQSGSTPVAPTVIRPEDSTPISAPVTTPATISSPTITPVVLPDPASNDNSSMSASVMPLHPDMSISQEQ